VEYKKYDNGEKKYVGLWLDDMSTGVMQSVGEYDPATHTMTEVGESSSPQGPMKVKFVTRCLDNDHFVFSMYTITPEGEQNTLEVTYNRKN
jgi:hypothetical protein